VKRARFGVLVALLVGCGGPTPSIPAVKPSTPAVSPSTRMAGPSASIAPTAIATTAAPSPPSPSAPPPAVVSVEAVTEVTYTGDVTAFTVRSTAGPPPIALSISEVTVDFGDGSVATAKGSCTASAPPLEVGHVFRSAGNHTVRAGSARLCDGESAEVAEDARILVLPAPPPSTRDWRTCTTFQLQMSGIGTGAGLGHIGVLLRLRNVSSTGCVLAGYPGIQLVSPTGAILQTVVNHPAEGDYLFPGIPAHAVALAPGGYAAFDLGYEDNPSGSGPYDLECPAARWVRIVLPHTGQFGTAEFPLAPCEGRVAVSPIFPGSQWISFQ
jgi:hypothetical protein